MPQGKTYRHGGLHHGAVWDHWELGRKDDFVVPILIVCLLVCLFVGWSIVWLVEAWLFGCQ